ncbi:hypothetical protein D9M70_543890 [compost metagenome]
MRPRLSGAAILRVTPLSSSRSAIWWAISSRKSVRLMSDMSSWTMPASTVARSRMSLTIVSSSDEEVAMWSTYSACRSLRSPKAGVFNRSAKPMMLVSGERSS